MAREEILAGPLAIWLAPVGETFPTLDEAPSGEWALVAQTADENTTGDGVNVNLPQSIQKFTPAGTAMAVKAFRSEEGIEVGITVADVRNEVFRYLLNDNSVDEGTGETEISLLRGIQVAEHALLARGRSPYEDSSATDVGQFQLPRCYQMAAPELAYNKGTPTGLNLRFDSLLPDSGSRADLKLLYSDASIV